MIMQQELTQNIEAIKKARAVKVFISSTFRDMHAERDVLVKKQFIKLRRECEERGIIWSEIDLRWGVTDEQKADGQVLPICLAEIDNCLPLFIGVLGERYGWVPELDEALVHKHPWLEQYRHKSVTELEIVYGGLLQNPNAMFYFRDPKYIESLDASMLPEFVEGIDETIPTQAELERRQQSLRDLKQRIRESGRKVHENYRDSEELGELIYEDLKKVIDEWFPLDEVPDPLAKEIYEHDCYSKVRSNFFVGRKRYLEDISSYVASETTKPLVIHGESGVGKSTLLSKWYQKNASTLRANNTYVIGHFIGATGQGTDSLFIVRRIIAELNQAFGLQLDIPTEYVGLSESLARALIVASDKGKIVILLDAINQLVLTDTLQGDKPKWLPETIPANVHLIVSTTTNSESQILFAEYDWTQIKLLPLLEEEQKHFIEQYLKLYSKSLERDVTQQILQHPMAKQPLFLMTLLEEIRIEGRENIEEIVCHYIESEDVEDLFIKRLQRIENDYNTNHSELVKDALSLLWVSNNGLTEMELRELLGNGAMLSSAIWSPFQLAMDTNLVNNGGIICLFHSYLRSTVSKLYGLENRQVEQQYRQRLVQFLRIKNYIEVPRISIELLTQLYNLEDWPALFDLLKDMNLVQSLWTNHRDLVQMYWTAIEFNTNPSLGVYTEQLTIVKAYEQLLQQPENNSLAHIKLIIELCQRRYAEKSMMLSQYLYEYYRRKNDIAGQLDAIGPMAQLFTEIGQVEKALTLYHTLFVLAEEIDSPFHMQQSLGGQATIYLASNHIEKAKTLLQKRRAICEQMGDKISLQHCLKQLCQIAISVYDIQEANNLLKQIEIICLEMGSQYEIQAYHGLKASVYRKTAESLLAIKELELQRDICRMHGYYTEEVRCLLSQAETMMNDPVVKRFNRVDIKKCIELALENAYKLNNERLLRDVLFVSTNYYILNNNPNLARKHINTQLEICKRLQLQNDLQMVLNQKIDLHRKLNEVVQANDTQNERINICRQYKLDFGLQNALIGQAILYDKMGEQYKRKACVDEALAICKSLNHIDGLITCYFHLADYYRQFDEKQKSIDYYQEIVELARLHKRYKRLNQGVYELSRLLMLQNRFDEALVLLQEWNPLYGSDYFEKIEGTIDICKKAVNQEPYEWKLDYIDIYNVTDLEWQVLELIADQGKVLSKNIPIAIKGGNYNFTREEMNKELCISTLRKKNLIKTLRKKEYALTDIGHYRLEQKNGKKYEVVEYLEHINKVKSIDFDVFSDSLQKYLLKRGQTDYEIGQSTFNVEIAGEVRPVFIYTQSTAAHFSDFLQEQQREKGVICFLASEKQVFYRGAVMDFYRWVKENFGDVRKAAALMDVYTAYSTLTTITSTDDFLFRKLKFD